MATASSSTLSRADPTSSRTYEPYRLEPVAIDPILDPFCGSGEAPEIDWNAFVEGEADEAIPAGPSTTFDFAAATDFAGGDGMPSEAALQEMLRSLDQSSSTSASPESSAASVAAPPALKRSRSSEYSQQQWQSADTEETTPPQSPKQLDVYDPNLFDFQPDASEVTGVSGAVPGLTTVLPFVGKLQYLLSKPQLFCDCLTWDQAGGAFIVSHTNPRLTTDVLPQVFSHHSVASLNRQLNLYSFHRLSPTELAARVDTTSSAALPLVSYHGWSHPLFRRDSKSEELALMRPKPSKARERKKAEKALQGRTGKRARRS